MNKTVLIAALAGAISASAVASPQIWFAPNTSAFLANRGDDAKWADARKHIDVYKFYYQQVVQDSPEMLKKKIDFLKENNIKIAVEWPALTWQENGPGFKVEGFGPVGMSKLIASKIKSAGGTLDYVAMDEIIYFGNYNKKGPFAPKMDIDAIAESAANNMKQVWSYFPNAKVGDIEPIDQISNFTALFNNFSDKFKQKTGKKISFLHYDVFWIHDWTTAAEIAKNLSVKDGMRFGVILNGDGGRNIDASWMESNRKHVKDYLASTAPIPDDVIFQSWNKAPRIAIGDTNDNSNSSIIRNRCCRGQVILYVFSI